ncbi:MAG TPA: hypothetical protein DD001_00100 [Microcoleaceae bacterium UBA10368]|nr:hypothetical protein [Microcoleaceae cyanobacterium UBA10368]HCV29428.1 hypothetical protein [Microcoleaceae cyanobacterium UBA9251]
MRRGRLFLAVASFCNRQDAEEQVRALGWLMRSGIFEIMFLDGRVVRNRVFSEKTSYSRRNGKKPGFFDFDRKSLNPKSEIQNPKLHKSTPRIVIEESNAARKR